MNKYLKSVAFEKTHSAKYIKFAMLSVNSRNWAFAILGMISFVMAACINSKKPAQINPSATETPSPQTSEILLPSPTLIPTATTEPTEEVISGPVFDQFVESIKTGEKGKIVGLWVEGKMALMVVYQPPSQPGFVSTIDNTATYFLLPYKMANNYGMLAHNYLAGRYFFDVNVGDIVQLVFGDGDYQDFEVVEIQSYQAIQPNNPRSEFIDLVSGDQLTANNLFIKVYMGSFHTTMQTCIAKGASGEWGRQFILAPPL